MAEDSLPSSDDRYQFAAWDELGAGAPTVVAYAAICSQAMVSAAPAPSSLSLPARTILFAARERGVFEIKGTYDAFEATARLLAVCVMLEDEQTLVFLNSEEPELTIRFLDGFRELCRAGLMMHHMYREFSLTGRGFDWARKVVREEVTPLLSKFPLEPPH